MFLAFRHEDLVDPDLPTFLTVWHARNWLPIGTFVPLRELGPADELVVMPTGGHSGEWAITDSTESKLMEWDEAADPVRVITSNALAFGFLGLATTEIRIPLEGRSTDSLYFFGGSAGGFGAAYLVHAVRHDRALSISAEPTGGPGGSINHRCG